MGKLDNIQIYLAGPINFVADDGVGWRQKLKKLVGDFNDKIKFFDPCNKPSDLQSEVGYEKEYVRKLKCGGQWDEVTKFVKNYRRSDLRMVDHSHAFVIYVDTSVHMCGSYDELHFAEAAHKPRYAILPNGMVNAPDWLFSQIRHEHMFDSVENFVEYLEQLDSGETPLDDRWVLI